MSEWWRHVLLGDWEWPPSERNMWLTLGFSVFAVVLCSFAQGAS